ncbi:MAG TPA: WYL domain-containing protein [Nocardioidaceae bacterium]|nr:WYL domain-containing protein [Nocardioidaceae bacterium]
MTARKSERLMNLVICLLVARTYVPKERIRDVVEGYREQSDDAFEKMFERDKEELRDLGIPIEVGYIEKGFEDEPGYRIRRDAFALPEIRLERDEAAVVGLAARVWQNASLAEATSSALLKLRAGGVAVDTEGLAVVEPQLGAQEAAFDPLWQAVVDRTPVRFSYQRPGAEAAERHLEPWGISSWHGHWYVVGHDRDRGAVRMFRLSRVVGPVHRDGSPGAYAVPEGTDIRALARSLDASPDTTETAQVRVRPGTGIALRRQAVAIETADADADSEVWDLLRIPFAGVWAMAEQIVSYGTDVVVEEPAALRAAVTASLQRLAGVSVSEEAPA